MALALCAVLVAAKDAADARGHTLRLVTCLEAPYPEFDGLNLSWEALEGLAKHNGPVANPKWALAEVDRAVVDALARHPPADPVTAVEHGDGHAGGRDGPRTRDPGDAGADDDDGIHDASLSGRRRARLTRPALL